MNKAVSRLPIIMLSMSRWDGLFSSASISLAKEFSKSGKVFYIDNPFTYKDLIKNFRKNEITRRKRALLLGRDLYTRPDPKLKNLIAVTPKIVMPVNWLPKGKLYSFFANWNDRVIEEAIRRIKRDYQIDEYILFNSFNPFYGHRIPEDITPHLRVYQSRDDISQSLYVSKHGVELETRAIEKSDIAMATSLGLKNKISLRTKKEIHYLPNAADIEIFRFKNFRNIEKPQEIAGINKRIIGYTGNICHRIDYELIREIAKKHQDKVLLLVGPRNEKKATDINLDEFSNIIFTGAKPIDKLPEYLAHVDCAIIPFKCNELTKSIYPLKINEYLAAGRAVVCTRFSKDLEGFEDVVYQSNSIEDFLNKIDTAIKEDTDELRHRRLSVAEKNTWQARVDLFWQFVSLTNENMNQAKI